MNIGEAACSALKRLKDNPDVKQLLDGLGAHAQKLMLDAAKSTPDQRIDATAHARGVFDVWVAMQAEFDGVRQPAVKPPLRKGGEV